MTVTAISAHAGSGVQSGTSMERAASQTAGPNDPGNASASSQVHISFDPPKVANTPIDRIGSGLLDTLRGLERTRAAKRASMGATQGGPASPVMLAKEELLAGPASIRPTTGTDLSAATADPVGFDEAVSAMTRSFDYAIETQLIVKTGSQFSSSASSLMRGQ